MYSRACGGLVAWQSWVSTGDGGDYGDGITPCGQELTSMWVVVVVRWGRSAARRSGWRWGGGRLGKSCRKGGGHVDVRAMCASPDISEQAFLARLIVGIDERLCTR